MHVALARKYRPRRFADLIGQEHVARALRGAVQQGRVAHGYLLCGPRGVGKTTAARILAMALNCETRHAGTDTGGEPCGSCASCQRIWAGSASLDVVEIDAASNRGVDDARELRERAMYAASQEGRHKVYIIDEAHMLTREAWNTLLKVLEEPPPGVVFVFATTEPHKIATTAGPVMSRLQRFDFRRVGPHAIGERLAGVAKEEGLRVDADAGELIARLADGGLRDALSVLDQMTAFGAGPITAPRVREVLGLVSDEVMAELLAIVAERRAAAVFPFVDRLVEAGIDLVTFADGAGDLLRATLAVRLGAAAEGISAALAEAVRARAAELAPGDLLRMLRALEESEETIRRGQTPRLTIELLIVRWALMDRTVDIADLLKGGAMTEKRRESGAVPSERPPMMRDSAPAGPTPGSRRSANLSVESIRAHWPQILDALRGERKMIAAEMLSGTDVVSVEQDLIVLSPQAGHTLAADSIERYRPAIEAAASRVLGSAVKVGIIGAELPERREPEAVPVERMEGPAPGSRRLSASGALTERAKSLRGKDPALDSAMDALDLELLE